VPKNKHVKVKDIALNLANPRTIPQSSESKVLDTMISINSSKFWGLMESIINDGYHPTENLILLQEKNSDLIVKEGNRRVAVLKIILGTIQCQAVPQYLSDKISTLSAEWFDSNSSVPCVIYTSKEIYIVDKVVGLLHAKEEPASRANWTAVARARYNRDTRKIDDPSLYLLEAYIKNGKNITPQQAERWSGDYPLTVLEDALPKIAKALGAPDAVSIAKSYPKKHKQLFEQILFDIGLKNLGFPQIRNKHVFFGDKYGLSLTPTSSPKASKSKGGTAPKPADSTAVATQPPVSPAATTKAPAFPLNDPHSVKHKLKTFNPKGNGRDKVVTLSNELKKLNIFNNPHAFCFILRSMFEISAKAYCDDHNRTARISFTKNGRDRKLVDVLRDITQYMTRDPNSPNKNNPAKQKELHGAITEIAAPDRLLSVTSMNQLIHNPNFSISPNDICIVFNKIFPLLNEMNN
jgi:hypothetical protein